MISINLDEHEVGLVGEYETELSKPTIDNVVRIKELQMLISTKVLAKVEAKKMELRLKDRAS